MLFAFVLLPYDNGKMLDAMVNGDKAKGTDPHSLNAKNAGITRGESKAILYGILYGSGDTLVGYNLWKPESEKTLDLSEFNRVKRSLLSRCKDIDNIPYFRVKKGLHVPLTDLLVKQTIFGKDMKKRFTSGIKGYDELIKSIKEEGKDGYITSLDGRHIMKQNEHSLLNYKLQSSGAVITKYWVYFTNELLLRKYKLTIGKDYIPTAIVHDEQVIAGKDDKAKLITTTLQEAIELTSKHLKLPTNIEIESFIGDDWTEH